MFYQIPQQPYSINPYSGELMALFDYHSPDQVQDLLQKSWHAFKTWSATSEAQRSTALLQIANELEMKKHELARLITLEMGKRIEEADAEVEKSISCFRHFAGRGHHYLEGRVEIQNNVKVGISKEAIGPILAIMPWNFPIWQVVRVLAPALLIGNTVMLKHADNTPQCAQMLTSIIESATGFPHLLNWVRIPVQHIEMLIADWRIRAVTLTGSEAAGRSVGALAGKHLKKSVLELGGSDAFIVLKDADLGKTIAHALLSRLISNGQSCVAAKRFIVQKEVYDAFLDGFAQAMDQIKLGDPLDSNTQLGPLARPDLLHRLMEQVIRSQQMGARLATSSRLTSIQNNLMPATVLADVRPGMPAFDEELFGPVAAVIRANDEEEAISLANHSKYGLGASIWTNDRISAEKLIHQLEVGNVFINSIVKSDPAWPFGGMKSSGYGRELGEFGVLEFANIKTYSIG